MRWVIIQRIPTKNVIEKIIKVYNERIYYATSEKKSKELDIHYSKSVQKIEDFVLSDTKMTIIWYYRCPK